MGSVAVLTGSSMGVMEGGGAGWFLAHWMTHGAPPMDALAVDSRRFGDWADRDYHVAKAIESFGLQFGVHYPHEERPAGRNKRLSPLHSRMAARGAVTSSWPCENTPIRPVTEVDGVVPRADSSTEPSRYFTTSPASAGRRSAFFSSRCSISRTSRRPSCP